MYLVANSIWYVSVKN